MFGSMYGAMLADVVETVRNQRYRAAELVEAKREAAQDEIVRRIKAEDVPRASLYRRSQNPNKHPLKSA